MKKWLIKSPEIDLVNEISNQLGISSIAAKIIVNRNISSADEAKKFLSSNLENLHNPFLMPDILKAVDRIRKALENKEKILVYGDSDVDGITSVCIMFRTLKSLGADVQWYITKDESYGLNREVIEKYSQDKINLIITVDCGISASPEIKCAKELGIDIIVTDHHKVPIDGIPEAYAVVDPKREDSLYPFSELAGCSVAFKVAEALMMSFGKNYDNNIIFLDVLRDKSGNVSGISGIKIKNNIEIEIFDYEGADVSVKFSGFVKDSKIIIYDNTEKEFLGDDIENEIFYMKELEKKYVTSEMSSIDKLAKTLKVDTETNKARLKYKVYRVLENMDDIRMKFFRETNLDVLTLGTIADIVPLVDENRIIVKNGLKNILNSRKVGLQILLEKCLRKSVKNISTKTISWDITPILNAAGRLGKAYLSAELMITDDIWKARSLVSDIIALNNERKALQTENSETFMPLLSEQCNLEEDKILIVTATGLEQGVTGIIASRIAREYERPVVLLIINDDEAVGSSRSIPGFDIVNALNSVRDILIKYGGHSQAAGLTISVDKIAEFKDRLKETAKKQITEEMLTPIIGIDAELQFNEVTLNLTKEMNMIEPFGQGNPHPIFTLSDMRINQHGRIGTDGSHLKMRVSDDNQKSLDAVGWGFGDKVDELESYRFIDVVFNLEINTWQDRKNLQLSILDIKPSMALKVN